MTIISLTDYETWFWCSFLMIGGFLIGLTAKSIYELWKEAAARRREP